jgi:hypothetical protein
MTVWQLLFHGAFVLACGVCIALGVYFIVCKRYEEGFWGNLAANGIVIPPAAVILLDTLTEGVARALEGPAIAWLVIGLTWLLGRHAWRSIIFWWAPRLGWKPPRDAVGPCASEAPRA